MIGNVRLVGQSLACTICARVRSLDSRQFPEDHVMFAHLHVSRLEAFSREHCHGATMPALPRAASLPKRRSA
jgi:hypothetical protein